MPTIARSFRRASAPVICGWSLLLAGSSTAGAQQPRSTLTGVVVSRDSAAISNAIVSVLQTRWQATSDADGRFVLALPQGDWRLLTTRIGYRPDTVLVSVGPQEHDRVITIRLGRALQTLTGITVESRQAPPMAASVTTETVRAVPPVGEPDIFRSVTFLPLVSQPNDLKGRLHLAGGSSDETAVTLDGHPLQDPFHLLGILGAFNVAALERADVMIHHIPAEHRRSLSGVIELETRRVSTQPSLEAVVSLLSTSLTTTARKAKARADVLASARATYLDKLVGLVSPDGRIAGEEIPLLGYQDFLLRLGWQPALSWRAEVVGFGTRDVIGVSDRSALAGHRPLSWGEGMAGVRLLRDGNDWDATLRASYDRSFIALDSSPQRLSFIDNTRALQSAAIEFAYTPAHWASKLGASVDRREHRHSWRISSLAAQIFSPNTAPDLMKVSAQTELAAFGEASVNIGKVGSATVGARVVTPGMTWYVGPHALLAIRAAAASIEVAVERRHQFFAELEEPIEGNVSPPTFLLSTPRMADVVALKVRNPVTLRSNGQGEVSAQLFSKAYTDRPVLQRSQSDSTFPEFARGSGGSWGASLGWRMAWGGDALVEGNYTFQRVLERIDGADFPTSWDAPHDLSGFVAVPLRGRWVASVAYRGHSGRAVTPIDARLFAPFPEFQTSLTSKYIQGERNSVRVASYHRLDIGVRRSWRSPARELTFFAQVLNVTNHRNAIDYAWDAFSEAEGGGSRPDVSRGGLPILPTFGFEVRW